MLFQIPGYMKERFAFQFPVNQYGLFILLCLPGSAGICRGLMVALNLYFLKIFSIVLPLASSSTSLSR